MVSAVCHGHYLSMVFHWRHHLLLYSTKRASSEYGCGFERSESCSKAVRGKGQSDNVNIVGNRLIKSRLLQPFLYVETPEKWLVANQSCPPWRNPPPVGMHLVREKEDNECWVVQVLVMQTDLLSKLWDQTLHPSSPAWVCHRWVHYVFNQFSQGLCCHKIRANRTSRQCWTPIWV